MTYTYERVDFIRALPGARTQRGSATNVLDYTDETEAPCGCRAEWNEHPVSQSGGSVFACAGHVEALRALREKEG